MFSLEMIWRTTRMLHGEGGKVASHQEGSGLENSPSSTDTTCMPSGESTKTVVSMLGDSDTVKAEDLAGRLESLASQLLLSSPRRPGTPLQAHKLLCWAPSTSLTSALSGNHIFTSYLIIINCHSNLCQKFSSRVLSDASVSSDPQHFVKAILGCLGKANMTNSNGGEEEPTEMSSRTEEMSRLSRDEQDRGGTETSGGDSSSLLHLTSSLVWRAAPRGTGWRRPQLCLPALSALTEVTTSRSTWPRWRS